MAGSRARVRRPAIVLLAVAAWIAAGCASVLSRALLAESRPGSAAAGHPSPGAAPYPYYSGTEFDAVCIASPLLAVADRDPVRRALGGDLVTTAVFIPLCLLDLPLSTVVDTALLPIDAGAHARYARTKAERSEAAARSRGPAPAPAEPAP